MKRRTKQQVILDLLDEHGEMYGLDLVKQSEGRLKKGTIYVHLSRMEQEGLVQCRKEEGELSPSGIRRRLYRITDEGHRKRSESLSLLDKLADLLNPPEASEAF